MKKQYLSKENAISFIIESLPTDVKERLISYFQKSEWASNVCRDLKTEQLKLSSAMNYYNYNAKLKNSEIKIKIKDLYLALGGKFLNMKTAHTVQISKTQFILDLDMYADENNMLTLPPEVSKRLEHFAHDEKLPVYSFLLKYTPYFVPKYQTFAADYIQNTIEQIEEVYELKEGCEKSGVDISDIYVKNNRLYSRIKSIRKALYPDLPIAYTVINVLGFKYTWKDTKLKIDEEEIRNLMIKKYINKIELSDSERRKLVRGVAIISARDNIVTADVYKKHNITAPGLVTVNKKLKSFYEHITPELHEKIKAKYNKKQLLEAMANPDSYIHKVDERGILPADIIIYSSFTNKHVNGIKINKERGK